MICPLGTLSQKITFGYAMLSFDRQNESLFLMGFSIHFISGNGESAIFDRSFDILAPEIETNILKALKVVTM
jgi:hypothetical protein